MSIKKNMLRERATKLPEVTSEMWSEVCEEHKDLFEEYFNMNPQLTKETIKQYRSGLKQFFYWVHVVLQDKKIYEITKKDFIKYRAYLQNHGLSSSALKFKQSSVSSLNNYIENVVSEEDEKYKSFRNFCRGLPTIAANQVYEKVKINRSEYELMMETLEKSKDYLGLAWLATAFNVGARRAEIIKFKSEIADYPLGDRTYVLTHTVFGKGSGDGKPLKYMVNVEALKYIKLWLDKRGYDHEYIFTTKHGNKINVVSESWADNFCTNVLSPILGRRVNPHIFKASAITALLEEGQDLALVSKYVAQHNDIATTVKFYDLREFEDERNQLFMR